MLKNKYIAVILKSVVLSTLFVAFSASAFAGGLRHVKQILVAPPALPIHSQVAKGDPVIIDVELTAIEKNWVIDGDGTQISGMTYNGSNPGPIIVGHVGDYVQLTLNNLKSNNFEHNIDLHAATGALGSAAINKVKPGESVTIRFKLIKSGIFTYHCAPGGIMIPYHIVQGMTGAIMVLPRGGLTDGHGKQLHYDRAYYIGENDFYIPKDEEGEYKKYDNASDAMADTLEVMRGLIPTHMGFGGKAFAYTGKNSLQAKVGENVLILHSQANNISSPHLIGGHADYVWVDGGFASPPVRDLQTWFIPAGGAVAAMYRFRYPGLYVYLNHNIIKAVMLGAAAHFTVTGQPSDSNLMQLVSSDRAEEPVQQAADSSQKVESRVSVADKLNAAKENAAAIVSAAKESAAKESAARLSAAKLKAAAIISAAQEGAAKESAARLSVAKIKAAAMVSAVKESAPKVSAVKKSAAKAPVVKQASAPQVAEGGSDSVQQILAAVESWRAAWSAQDVSSYFERYADDFKTLPKFPSIRQWKQHKKRVISKSGFIKVTLSDIQVYLDRTGSKAYVRFHQSFTNGRINEEDVKTLVMVARNGSWKILRESVEQ